MIAGFALAAGLPFAVLFGVSAAGCGCLFCLLALLLKETRPLGGPATGCAPLVAETVTEGAPGMVLEAAGAPVGYRRVLADRRFLAFCAITLLPLFCSRSHLHRVPHLLNRGPARLVCELGAAARPERDRRGDAAVPAGAGAAASRAACSWPSRVSCSAVVSGRRRSLRPAGRCSF